MQTHINPEKSTWSELCRRPAIELEFLDSTVRNIMNRVKIAGDDALRELALRYDKVQLDAIRVSADEIADASRLVSPQLKSAIEVAAKNIDTFHRHQHRSFQPVETMPGVKCWRKAVPVERVGIYIPGGTAPLFSTVLMLAIPARIAGCKEIVLCSPPDSSGKIAAAIIYAAHIAGVSQMFKAGGAQAIAALAYGTASIPAVHKIFGPGNQYVTKAKQLVSQEGTPIDLPAGPSEVLVVADSKANPAYVAADLLSQAEHGTDSQVVLVTDSRELLAAVQQQIEVQLDTLPRKDIARGALENSLGIVLQGTETIASFVNEYAPEHLIINTTDAEQLAERVTNAGSVFIGQWSPESVGDYASGTNHTLPTNGFAKAWSGVSLESFQKYITYQMLTGAGLRQLGPSVEIMAEAEQLAGHGNAIRVRLNDLK